MPYTLELCVRKKKKKERKKTKLNFSRSVLFTLIRINATLGVYFALEALRVFGYESFASLCPCHFEPTQSLLKKYYCTSSYVNSDET